MPDQLHTKYLLDEYEMPSAWYNILPDLPRPLPPVLHPGTHQPIGPADLAALFPMALIMQEVSSDRYIEIPDPVREVYAQWRPSAALPRAPSGKSARYARPHLLQVRRRQPGGQPQAEYRRPAGVLQQAGRRQEDRAPRPARASGDRRWRWPGAFFGVEIEVFMVKVSYHQKPYRRSMMQTYGATVHASPTDLTEAGRSILAKDPNSPGSLGIAISEAVEVAATSGGTIKYSLGSVLNHVLMHQTIIGEEALLQMAQADDYPDVVIGCVGGGSNMAGLVLPVHPRERATRD